MRQKFEGVERRGRAREPRACAHAGACAPHTRSGSGWLLLPPHADAARSSNCAVGLACRTVRLGAAMLRIWYDLMDGWLSDHF